MAKPGTYSIWIVPGKGMKGRLYRRIKELSGMHNATPFEPHLTLVKDIKMGESEAVERTKGLAGSLGSFAVKLGRPSSSQSYFKSVFIKVRKTGELYRAYRQASEAFGLKSNMYRPHISLIYASLPASKRRSIVKGLKAKELGGSFVADNLHLHRTEGGVEGWRCVFKARV
ncbi:MAG: 2'-5' RNA ligase family protein [Candidatus Micrarchaeota archaeon]|nr:2'-5' RNA ligase family protein [Candidatus Micrarchaeota archaeon]MDE1823788.1 2'-5' RNA ligase family protein [Candidatus Micrarchaeota archaeon]MDE1849585.1 2'-5' RNA ligase family protein [Candidatus Micrarchaeota archaeon]